MKINWYTGTNQEYLIYFHVSQKSGKKYMWTMAEELMGEVGKEDLHMEWTDYVQNFRSEMICPNPRTSACPGPGIILLAR